MEKNNKEINEGKAHLFLSDSVFYNARMKNLRDISVLFVRTMKDKDKTMSLLDCTAATGVRSIRYAKEVGIENLTAIDINKDAANILFKNMKLNEVYGDFQNISLQEFSSKPDNKKFDFIDLDPFGSPQPYLNDIMKLSKDNTIVMITATDTAVLCGAHSNACIKIYGAKPMHNKLCKESGIRILIMNIAKVAATFNMGIKPLISISDMHYMRVFIQLKYGAKKAVDSLKELGFASFCKKCKEFDYKKGFAPELDKKCVYCNEKNELFGQFYLGEIKDNEVISRMIEINKEINILNEKEVAFLLKIKNELHTPFFYSIPDITKSLKHKSVSPDKIIEILDEGGFISTKTQFDKDGIKTTSKISEVISALQKNSKIT
ncbi:MAG: tRNA (guanine(10)-N(2))-dimethyltransferase [Candidatus Micrarchaeaceae archaeon]